MKFILLSVVLCRLVHASSWQDDLETAQRLRQAGQSAAAERVYQEILGSAQQLNAAQLNALGMELQQQMRYGDAERVYRQSLEEWDRLGPATAASRSITAANLGTLLQLEGRYREAEPLLLERLRAAEGANPAGPDTGNAAGVLAVLYHAWGQLEKAELYAVRAGRIFGALPGQPDSRLATRRVLASILLDERRYTEGEALLRGLLPDLPAPSQVGAYNDLAVAEIRQNRFAAAEPLVMQALELARRVLPPDDPVPAASLNNLAQIQRFQGRYLEAEKNYRAAIDIWRRALGPRHPDVAKGLVNLAAFYHERGREAGAEDLYRQAAAIFDTAFGSGEPLALAARNELGDVLRAEHRYSESERLSRDTMPRLEKLLGDEDPRVLRALANRARLLQDTRHTREAAAVWGRIQGLQQGFTVPN